jgi:hypothetical protein
LDRIEESLTHPLPDEHREIDKALRHLRKLERVKFEKHRLIK